MARLSNKRALITGASTGIGLATAEAFQREGAEVVINGRNSERLEAARQSLGGKVTAALGDVAKLSDLDEVIAKATEGGKKLDILFANAGIAELAHVAEVDEEHFDRQFDINVKGLFFTIQKALPHMNPGGSIIVNASIVQQKGMPNMSVYSATKAAVRSFARTLTTDLMDRRIRVNSISPGPIETPIYGKMGLSEQQSAELGKSIVAQVPLRTFGEPRDIAEAVVFLASDESKFVTGIDLVVDGGLSQV